MSETLSPHQILAWHHDMGVDEAIGDDPIDRFNLPKENPKSAQPVTTPSSSAPSTSKAVSPSQPIQTPAKPFTTAAKPNLARSEPLQQASLEETINNAKALAHAATDLMQLKDAIKSFDTCPLKRTAANTLFGHGSADADLMIIGEIPDADEDRQGIPFAGSNGEMLSKMMQAIGFAAGIDDVYSTTALPWRPPGNRKPTPLEWASCLPFLQRHIELVKPKCLLIMGGSALRELTGSKDRVNKARGKWLDVTVGEMTIPTMATYHPTYLTKQKSAKKETWADLLLVKEKLNN